MARKGRVKSPQATYHIICRSISEVALFRDDEDKNQYLNVLNTYKDKYICSVYEYCVMDTHFHMLFNPNGFDVSKFMHGINTSYVRYYNKKYARRGALFQDRFESSIVDSEEYALTVSAYIHNNPKAIEGYTDKEHLYPYSSYGIYLGIRKDTLGLIDMSFIRSLFSVKDAETFPKRYNEFVTYKRDTGYTRKPGEKLSSMVEYEYISGRNVILRDKTPAHMISYISGRLLRSSKPGMPAANRRDKDYRAFCAYALKVLCGLGYKDICQHICNSTISGCAILFNRGYELVNKNKEYEGIFYQLVDIKAA